MIRHTKLHVLARRFEGDPRAQYAFHKWSARFWLVNAVVVTGVYFFAPPLWAKASVFYLVLISIYAAWATEFGAMAASEAASDEPVSTYSIDTDTTTTETSS